MLLPCQDYKKVEYAAFGTARRGGRSRKWLWPRRPHCRARLIYQKNCARCHGAKTARLGLNGAHDLTKSNLNEFGRTYLVTNGMGKMPAFGKTLTPAQVQQVVAYSLTLK